MGQLLQPGVLLLVIFATRETFEQRIIGGRVVEPHSIPYQASIQYYGRHFCGGTLIATQWVLSAAHCWRPYYLIKVVLSEHSLSSSDRTEQTFLVSRIFVRRNYNYRTFDSDIMLLRLRGTVVLTDGIQLALLPNVSQPERSRGHRCTVSGWGVTQVYSYYLSPELRAVDVEVIGQCWYYYYSRITNNMLCAGSIYGGKDSCQGDSGGPLMCDGYVEGIVSWGISCANPYFPGVYTKVRNFVGWIEEIMDMYSMRPPRPPIYG